MNLSGEAMYRAGGAVLTHGVIALLAGNANAEVLMSWSEQVHGRK